MSRLFNTDQAAKYLGVEKRWEVYNLARRGHLPSQKRGQRVFFSEADLARCKEDIDHFSGLLDTSQASRYLLQSRWELYNLTASGKLPVHKRGSRSLFAESDLREYKEVRDYVSGLFDTEETLDYLGITSFSLNHHIERKGLRPVKRWGKKRYFSKEQLDDHFGRSEWRAEQEVKYGRDRVRSFIDDYEGLRFPFSVLVFRLGLPETTVDEWSSQKKIRPIENRERRYDAKMKNIRTIARYRNNEAVFSICSILPDQLFEHMEFVPKEEGLGMALQFGDVRMQVRGASRIADDSGECVYSITVPTNKAEVVCYVYDADNYWMIPGDKLNARRNTMVSDRRNTQKKRDPRYQQYKNTLEPLWDAMELVPG